MNQQNIGPKQIQRGVAFTMNTTDKTVMMIDGFCNLCSTTVIFTVKRDPKGLIQFAALQSPAGQEILRVAGRL